VRRQAATGVSTGISAADRAHTIRVAAAPDAKASDIVHPGHVFPLIAQPGGVLARAGHTEACCDLAALAGLTPAAVLCEIMNADGTMARLPDLERFAAEHGLKIGAIADLIQHQAAERLVERIAERRWQPCTAISSRRLSRQAVGRHPPALVRGPVSPDTKRSCAHEPLSVMDSSTPAAPHSWSIAAALAAVAQAGRGVVVLLHRPESARNCARALGTEARRRQGRSSQLRHRRADPRDLSVGKMALPPRKMPSMAASISKFGLRRAAAGAQRVVATHANPDPSRSNDRNRHHACPSHFHRH
jgi:3,4-dihydroxy 2-butanone 4-phosphate synthase/GTP cyclohydrolase II